MCLEDAYPPDEKEDIEEEEQVNPCYHATQMEMADILRKRIETIFRYHHNTEKPLSEVFDMVEFAVYTVRFRMLSDQTEK